MTLPDAWLRSEPAFSSRVAVAVLSALLLCAAPAAWCFDVFRTEAEVPTLPSASMLGSGHACAFGPLGQPVSLQEAIERALCNNPKTHEAWASVKLQAAGVGVAKGRYLPTLSGSWQDVRDHSATDVDGQPQLSSAQAAMQRSESLSLSWVLYDFGGRGAALDNAVALLTAAQANQQAILQAVFVNVAKDYYAAQAASGSLVAAQEVEQTANDSFKAATQRVAKGAAPISDQLQAQTSYAQAIFNRAKASGDSQIALGTLAADLDLAPYLPIGLPAVADGVASSVEFNDSVVALIQEAKRTHPSVLVAEAQLEAADAKVQQVRAEGLPSLSLVARESRNNQAVSPVLGSSPLAARARDAYIGVQITVPLFEGLTRTYQIRQAGSQSEVQAAMVAEAKQKVALDVWSSFHALGTASENIVNSATLLDIAQQSYAAAQHRYLSGVGSILELLNAQASLAAAKKQRIQALTDWRTARLQLAGALGKLGMWNIEASH